MTEVVAESVSKCRRFDRSCRRVDRCCRRVGCRRLDLSPSWMSPTRLVADLTCIPTYTTTTPPPFQNHHAIQNQTPTSQRSNHQLHHTGHPEYSTLQPAICPHRGIQIILLPKHHQTMEQPTTCNNQQHNHTTT